MTMSISSNSFPGGKKEMDQFAFSNELSFRVERITAFGMPVPSHQVFTGYSALLQTRLLERITPPGRLVRTYES
jgi:hypothetical protein